MCQRHSVEFEVGFADSELISYERGASGIRVIISAWNERVICLEFTDAITMVDYGAWSFSDICEFEGDSPTMNKALRMQYDPIPSEHPYRLFQFLNEDDEPSIEVVAEKLLVSFV